MRRFLQIAAAAVTAAILPSRVSAQQWSVGADAGRIRSTLDPMVQRGVTLAARAGYDDQAAAFHVSAGLPTSGDSVRWAAVGAWKRFSATRRGLTAGVDLSGSAFAFQLHGHAAQSIPGLFGPLGGGTLDASRTLTGRATAAEALPLVEYGSGPLQLQARTGLSYYDASARDSLRDRVVTVSDLQLAIQPSARFALVPALRRYRARREDAATLAEVSAMGVAGPLELWSRAGRWVDVPRGGEARNVAWSVGGELRVTSRASLSVAARHDGFDPLYLTPSQTSWNVGGTLVLGSRSRRRAEPIAAHYENGVATIRLPASLFAWPPLVAGDFNNWTPAAMERVGDSWRYAVAARPGVYDYAFVAPDGTWYVPEGVPGRKDDGMGGHVAVVVVQ